MQLAYFGTDQSQVQRYLAGGPLAESRRGLLMNGLLKVPMQLFILFIGVMVFVVYQLTPPPLFFNRAELERVRASHPVEVGRWRPRRPGSSPRSAGPSTPGSPTRPSAGALRDRRGAGAGAAEGDRRAGGPRPARGRTPKDADFIFLRFVLDHFPRGLIGLLVAVILSAAMSANSAALSSLGATTVVDFYRPRHPDAPDARTLAVARWSTAAWGVVAVGFATFASLLDNLIQAVNVLGSLFYGPMLGVFVVGFFLARVGGRAAFWATVAGEIAVLAAATLGEPGVPLVQRARMRRGGRARPAAAARLVPSLAGLNWRASHATDAQRCSLACCLALSLPAFAQGTAPAAPAPAAPAAPAPTFQADVVGVLGHVQKEMVALEQAIPQTKFTWRPAKGVRSVAEVYLHAAGSAYFFGKMLGFEIPAEIAAQMKTFETSTTDKAKIQKALDDSFAWFGNQVKAHARRRAHQDDGLLRPRT